MDCKEEIVDSRIPDPKAFEIGSKNAQILFKLNHTMPMTEEYGKVVKELFGDNISAKGRCSRLRFRACALSV